MTLRAENGAGASGAGDGDGGRESNFHVVSKHLLFSINCITFICGLILFFLGVVLQAQYATYFEFLDDSFYSVSLWCLAVGVIVCLVSFLGENGVITVVCHHRIYVQYVVRISKYCLGDQVRVGGEVKTWSVVCGLILNMVGMCSCQKVGFCMSGMNEWVVFPKVAFNLTGIGLISSP
jgi:hypothetical protein